MLSVGGWLMYALNRSRLVAPVSFGCHRYTAAAQSAPNSLIDMVKSFIPPLTYDQHKGQSGRVAVFGGCQEYTGAPYFAAISALKLGADLSHVFCTQEAATVIKSYSPELIVHPIINSDNLSTTSEETSTWLERMHAVILGPGLGRDINTLKYAEAIIEIAKEKCLPIIIDADGLFLITQKPELIKGYKHAILTPNVAEFSRLYEKVFGKKPREEEPVVCVKSLAERLGNITIVQKGFSDVMSDGDKGNWGHERMNPVDVPLLSPVGKNCVKATEASISPESLKSNTEHSLTRDYKIIKVINKDRHMFYAHG